MSIITTFGWALCAGAGGVAAIRPIRVFAEWLDIRPDGSVSEGRSSPIVHVTSTVAALAFGGAALWAAATGGAFSAGGTAAGVAVGAPNAPSITATVYRDEGDSIWVDGGTFSGSGGDTHANTYIWVDTAGGTFSPPKYHGDTIAAATRDSIGGNLAALDSGAVVDIIMAYEGTSGGWSAPDTLTGVTVAKTAGVTVFFQCDWPNVGTGDTYTLECGTTDFQNASGSAAYAMSVVDASDVGLSANWPNDRALKIPCKDRGDNACMAGHPNADSLWAFPDSGASLFYRVYFTWGTDMLTAGNVGADDHPFEDTNGGGSNSTYMFGTGVQSADSFGISIVQNGTPWPDNKLCLARTGGCNGGDIVRFPGGFEAMMEYGRTWVTDTTYYARCRLWDVKGDSIMYEGDDWKRIDGAGGNCGGTREIQTTSARRNWDLLMVGSSALAGLDAGFAAYDSTLYYWGGLAVCDTFCGKWGSLPGEN